MLELLIIFALVAGSAFFLFRRLWKDVTRRNCQECPHHHSCHKRFFQCVGCDEEKD